MSNTLDVTENTRARTVYRELLLDPNWSISWDFAPQFSQRIRAANSEIVSGFFDDEDSGAKKDKLAYSVVNGVATVYLVGPLVKKDAWYVSWMGGTSTDVMRQILGKMETDPTVQRIKMVVDSPGGMVSGTDELANVVARVVKSKPITAFVDGMCASAAYWISSQCSKIYATRTSQIGSIGTYMVLYDTSEMYKQMGVEVVLIKAGKYKGAGMSGTKVTKEQRVKFQENIDALNDVFVAAVAKGRGYSSATMDLLATGEVWVGETAKTLGLIDGIKTEEQVNAYMSNVGVSPGLRADATTDGRNDMAQTANQFDLAARLLASLSHPEQATEETADPLDTYANEHKGDSIFARIGLWRDGMRHGQIGASTALVTSAVADLLIRSGIETVAQLTEQVDYAAIGRQFEADAREYATKQAIRAFGVDKGLKISAGLKSAKLGEITERAAGWEAEADAKFGIGKASDGSVDIEVQGATRRSAASDLSNVRSVDVGNGKNGVNADGTPMPVSEERRQRLLRLSPLGQSAVRNGSNGGNNSGGRK